LSDTATGGIDININLHTATCTDPPSDAQITGTPIPTINVTHATFSQHIQTIKKLVGLVNQPIVLRQAAVNIMQEFFMYPSNYWNLQQNKLK